MNTPATNTQNRIIAPICIGLGLLLSVLFLRPAYATYIENSSVLTSLQTEYSTISKEYDELVKIRDNISSLFTEEQQKRIEKLAKKFDTSDIMTTVMLNDFTKDRADQSALITISSISVNKGKKLPNGLSLGSINLSFQGKTIADIIAFITFLTQETSYVFTLDNISLPIDTNPDGDLIGSYALGIELGAYYYE